MASSSASGAAAAAAVAVAALPAVAEPKVVVYERLNPFTTTLNAITRAAGVAPTVVAAAKAEADAAAAGAKAADATAAVAAVDGAGAGAAAASAGAAAAGAGAAGGALPSDAALHDLLGYLSDANHKLYALRHNLIATVFALYRACKSLAAHESTRVVLVRILQSAVVASEGRAYVFRHGVLELLALLEDDAAPVRQAACRVLFTLSGFPDVTKQMLDKRQVLQALTRAFLFDEAAVALETLPTFAVLSRHDPQFLTLAAMRKLADTLRAFSAVGDDHSAMHHCTAILQCLVHATGGDHTLAQTEMAVALKLVDTVAHILLTTADRKLFPALPPAPVVAEPAAAAAPADGGAAASVITPRQPDSGWALSASSLAAAKEELRRLSSACLLTLTVALSGKMALIGFHSPRAIEYLCHLAMDPGTSAAVRTNAIHTIRNIAEHPTGLHAAGVHLLRKSELIYSILGAALTATVVSSLLDDARSGEHALSALSLLCTTGESTRATAWSRILELVPRLVGRLTAPHAPDHTRHTASRCLYLVCTENPDALNELNKAVAAPVLRAEVLKFASDPLRELIRTGDTAALAQLSKEKAAASASAAAAGSAAVPAGALPSPKHRLSQNQSQLHTALHKSILTGDLPPAAAAPANSAKPAVL